MSLVITVERVLPPEVVDHILDGLASGDPLTASDRKDLSNCSLVCRTWLPRSSAHLLKSISVPARDLERYLTFAKTSTRLATHVREFTLSGSVNVMRYLEAMFDLMPRLNHLELLNNLTPLERLYRLGGTHDHMGNPMPSNPTQTPPHIDSTFLSSRNYQFTLSYLKMDHVHLASLIALLRSFSQIETLEFRSGGGEGEYQDAYDLHDLFDHVKIMCTERFPHLLPVTATVKNMVFADNSAVAGMIAFLSMRPVTITLKDVFPADLRHTLGFLNDVGRDVEHVKLLPAKITGDPGRIRVNWDSTDLRRSMRARDGICPKLQTLELSIGTIELTSVGLSNILRQLPSTMRQLRIILHIDQLLAVLDAIRVVIGSDAEYYNLQSIELRGAYDGEPLSPGPCLAEAAARLPRHLSSIVQVV